MMKHDIRRATGLAKATVSVGLSLALAGCISVKTPEKPIEINLNVNIKQEVLVRLQRDVEQLINQNPQAFPQNPPQKPQ